MPKPTALRSPVALLTALALLCGTLATVLALSTPASAATRHGTVTLTPASGPLSAGPASVTASAACPAPADPARPYVKGVLVLVNPGDPAATAPIAEVAPGGPLGTTPLTGPLTAPGPGYATLQDRLRELVPAGPLDGRYELRLSCETADSEARAEYFSQMIEVTGEDWAAVSQQATNLKLASDSATPPAGRPFPIRATVEPATATGTVSFLTLDTATGEAKDLGTAEVVSGTAQITATMHDEVNLVFPVLAQYTPADPAAWTPSQALHEFAAGPATTPTPTDTPTGPTGTPTPTDTTPTPTDGPTDDPTDEPTDDPTDGPTDEPTDEPTPTDTPSGTLTATAPPTSGTSGGSSGDSGSTGTGSTGTSGDTGTSGATGGGSGSSGGAAPQGGSGGTLAATGAASAASAALGALALCLLGAAAMITVRRRKAVVRP
ncbi:LPXTG cell wall anchor domain-containing protein [Streptomyces sp. NPDC057854]|uniref:LPXTG cell wall anchor domain-containing protein n=1 Tax=unclassified Streptomyces TaxID=2593676 RepID=UPI0036CC880B